MAGESWCGPEDMGAGELSLLFISWEGALVLRAGVRHLYGRLHGTS